MLNQTAALLEGAAFNVITLAVAVIAGVAGVLSAVYARKTLFPPKRRLHIGVSPRGSAVSDLDVQHGFQLTFNGQPVPQAKSVDIAVANTGRHSITSEMFDRGRPIIVDLGVPILTIGRSEPSEAIRVNPDDGNQVLIGPELVEPTTVLAAMTYVNGTPNPRLVSEFVIGTRITFYSTIKIGELRLAPIGPLPVIGLIFAILGTASAILVNVLA